MHTGRKDTAMIAIAERGFPKNEALVRLVDQQMRWTGQRPLPPGPDKPPHKLTAALCHKET
jgi:hypothetical protein